MELLYDKNEAKSLLDSANEMVNESKNAMNDTRRLIARSQKNITTVQSKIKNPFRKR